MVVQNNIFSLPQRDVTVYLLGNFILKHCRLGVKIES